MNDGLDFVVKRNLGIMVPHLVILLSNEIRELWFHIF